MPQSAASHVRGLYKHHNRGCAHKGGKPTHCDCPWYGYYKRVYKGLAEWSGQDVDPRSRRVAEVVLNRLKAAVDNRTYSREGEHRSLGSGQRFCDFVDEWRLHYAAEYGLTSNSLESMLHVLVEGFGHCTLEYLASAPVQIERWLNASQKARTWSDNT